MCPKQIAQKKVVTEEDTQLIHSKIHILFITCTSIYPSHRSFLKKGLWLQDKCPNSYEKPCVRDPKYSFPPTENILCLLVSIVTSSVIFP